MLGMAGSGGICCVGVCCVGIGIDWYGKIRLRCSIELVYSCSVNKFV